MNAIQVRNIGQTVERASIRCGNKDIVMAGIRQGGTKAAENRLGNAIGRDSCLADISRKAGLIEPGASYQAFANQCNSGSSCQKG